MQTVSILLVDDSPFFLRVAARFLSAYKGINVIGSAGSGREALAKLKDLRPDVILVDLSMPDLPGLEIIPQLRISLPDVGIVALTSMEVSSYRPAALAAGADEFVSKDRMVTELLPAIQRISQRTDHNRGVKSVCFRGGESLNQSQP